MRSLDFGIRLAALVFGIGLAALGCGEANARDATPPSGHPSAIHPTTASPRGRRWTGEDFPEGVLALTWDDGPDVGTTRLAQYLHDRKVSATFFVVREWVAGISDEPGIGGAVERTGYGHLPVLGELTRLGHRIGGHTQNHVILTDVPTAVAAEQLANVARDVAPFVTNELAIFRAPGGAWSAGVAAIMVDPPLSTASLVGPIHWDIDAKDWDASLSCRDSRVDECEPGPVDGELRVRPAVVARRYLGQIERKRRGIVLFHDRVGDVGSRYARDVAEALIPELQRRGYVFAAPVLGFSPMAARLGGRAEGADDVLFGDVDGDGRSDACALTGRVLACRAASSHATWDAELATTELPRPTRRIALGDVDGDGRSDACALTDRGIECANRLGDGHAGSFELWSADDDLAAGAAASFRLADVDGDGRADACVRAARGILCAPSRARTFERARLWLALPPEAASTFELADVDGDRRADVCVSAAGEVDCALSNGHAFGPLARWSRPGDLARGARGEPVLGDLNGDGRADACDAAPDGVRCALSNGRGFLAATIWAPPTASPLRFVDLNGDRRVDLCTLDTGTVSCGLAP